MQMQGKSRFSFNLPIASILSLLILFSIVTLIRYPLLNIPLGRSEGGYAYGAQLLLHGGLPYVDFYSMKLPGAYVVYAVIFIIFGESVKGIHLGLLCANLITILFIYLLASRYLGRFASIIAASSFAILSLGLTIQGFYANTEQFIIPLVVAVFYFIPYLSSASKKFVFSTGLLLGFAFLIKQHAIFFIVCGFLLLFFYRDRNTSIKNTLITFSIFGAGIASPYLLTFLIYLISGNIKHFLLWTLEYPADYVSQVPLKEAATGLFYGAGYVFSSMPVFWLIAFIGLVLAFINLPKDKSARFNMLIFIFSFLAITPGLYFRPHYFQLLLPSAAMLSGYCFEELLSVTAHQERILYRYGIALLGFLLAIEISFHSASSYLVKSTPLQISRAVYGNNPFPESIKIANYLKQKVLPNETIAVLGSEPQIYFYSKIKSATGYLYMYPMMEKHKNAQLMQQQFVSEIKQAKPEYIVYVHVATSWLQRPDSEMFLFQEMNQFIKTMYQLDAIVNVPVEKYIQREPNDSSETNTKVDNWISIYRKGKG